MTDDHLCNVCDQPPVTPAGGGLCWEHFAEIEAIAWWMRWKKGQDSPHLHIHRPN